MKFFDTVGKTLTDGLSRLEERNKRNAHLNRIRAALKREEKAAQRKYIALGRYYYNSLRDKNDPVAEQHSLELDEIEIRINKAVDMLEQCYAEAAAKKAELHEEIDLDDAKCFDSNPIEDKLEGGAEKISKDAAKVADMLKESTAEIEKEALNTADTIGEGAAKTVSEVKNAADTDENDNLPFE